MADNLPPELYAEQQALNRQQQMAALLMQQGMQGQQQAAGQMVSGRYVPNSFFQNLVPLANMAASQYAGSQGDKRALDLAQKIREGKSTAEATIQNKMLGTPDVATEMAGPYGGNVPMPVSVVPGAKPDLAGALREIDSNQYGAGKDLKPLILKQLMPEDTADYKNYLKVKPEFDAKGIPISFNQYQDMEANRKRPVTNFSVNTGQRGFDNALKLRSDFRSEPTYKGFQEVESAFKQINQGLDAKSPAGDLAAATKFMKILDPGSVVRESELGMAMQAGGALDRLQNYAQMRVNGTLLTPTQRQDFKKLATDFYSSAADQYSIKQNEYSGIAERNGLNTKDVTGTLIKAPNPLGNVNTNSLEAELKRRGL